MNTKQTPSSLSSFGLQRRSAASFALLAPLMVTACGGGDDDDASSAAESYPHANEPIGTVIQMYDGNLTPDLAVNTFRNIDRLFPTRALAPSATPYALPKSDKQITNVQFTASSKKYDIYDYLALNRVSGLLILKDGKIANETYQYGNTEKTRWMSMSVAKSITSTLIGMAVKDGYIGSINDVVTKYVPRLAGTAYGGVTIRNVMMMASGTKWNETYTDPTSDRRALLNAQISQKAGSLMDVMAALPRATTPGSIMNYSTGETQVAGEIVIGATKKNLADYLQEKIWSKYGMEATANWWLDSPDGHEIGGSGFSATLRDFGRFGLFIMNDGFINGTQVLPAGWVAEAGSPKVLTTGLTEKDYGYLWWVTTSGQSLIDQAFYGTGIFGQNVYINQKEKVVIVTWGAQSKPSGAGVISNTPFFDAVVAALK
jgi:CubicO group peptidase (beta-lactamase class C family)